MYLGHCLLKLTLEFNQMSIFNEEPVYWLSPINPVLPRRKSQLILSYQGENHDETTLSWKDNICCAASQAFTAHILEHNKVFRNAERVHCSYIGL